METIMNDRVQPAERAYLVWAAPAGGVGGMNAAVKPAWMYVRPPLAGAAQTSRGEKRKKRRIGQPKAIFDNYSLSTGLHNAPLSYYSLMLAQFSSHSRNAA